MAKQSSHSHCSYCGTPISRSPDSTHRKWRVDFLIPIHLGGSDHPKNLVLCCAPCLLEKNGRDWIDWGVGPTQEGRVRLANMRIASLEESLNHVIPLSVGKGKSARKNALAYIFKRWAHPRFKLYATVTETDGWFAIKAINDSIRVPLKTRLFIKRVMTNHSGFRIEQNGWRIYQVPLSGFHEVAFHLIERNALLAEAGVSFNLYWLEPEHYRRWFIHLKWYEWIQDVVDHANELKLLRRSHRIKAEDNVEMCVIEEQRQVDNLKSRRNARGEFNV